MFASLIISQVSSAFLFNKSMIFAVSLRIKVGQLIFPRQNFTRVKVAGCFMRRRTYGYLVVFLSNTVFCCLGCSFVFYSNIEGIICTGILGAYYFCNVWFPLFPPFFVPFFIKIHVMTWTVVFSTVLYALYLGKGYPDDNMATKWIMPFWRHFNLQPFALKLSINIVYHI